MDQNQAQNTSLDSVTAYKSKQQPNSNLKSRYESKTGFKVMNWIKKLKNLIEKFKIGLKSSLKAQYTKFLYQNQAQNTSLDSVTAYKSKQQPKSCLKSRYESETRFKVMNLVKNWIKINLKILGWTRAWLQI